MEQIFKRKLYDRLLKWKSERKGRTAILIEGARRVGKSTIASEFARNEYVSHIIIDFNKASKQVSALFDDLMDLDYIFMRLQIIYNVELIERKSVIIFDEVQKCPQARQAIKYLVADRRYDYIETGSLISIKQNTKNITIPSEEERVPLHPMDFEEFLWALGDTATMPLLRNFLTSRKPLKEAHRAVMHDLRLYMLIGGMPQAVDEYLASNNLSRVDLVKRDILNLYKDDFMKLDSTGRLEQCFMNIPAQLSSNCNRYKPHSAIGEVNDRRFSDMLTELADSKTVNFAYHTDDPNVGMSLTKNLSKYKIFCADTGLFITLAFWDKDYTENVIYQKLLNDKLSANLGYVYENLVAQMLTAAGYRLFYHTWAKDPTHNYEIDFLVSSGAKLVPIEVKSSGYRTHASLDAFAVKYSRLTAGKLLVYTKDYGNDGDTTFLPAYMTPLI